MCVRGLAAMQGHVASRQGDPSGTSWQRVDTLTASAEHSQHPAYSMWACRTKPPKACWWDSQQRSGLGKSAQAVGFPEGMPDSAEAGSRAYAGQEAAAGAGQGDTKPESTHAAVIAPSSQRQPRSPGCRGWVLRNGVNRPCPAVSSGTHDPMGSWHLVESQDNALLSNFGELGNVLVPC